TILPTSVAIRGVAQAGRSAAKLEGVSEHRKIAADGVPAQRLPFFDGEHFVGGVIGGQHYALAIQSQDRRRAALDQDLQLLLGLAPQVLFTPAPHASDDEK